MTPSLPDAPFPPNPLMQKNAQSNRPALAPDQDAVRDYAYHLYEQSGNLPGHDVENWLEARACLQAHIPRQHSHARLHRHVSGLGPLEQEELCVLSIEAHNIAI